LYRNAFHNVKTYPATTFRRADVVSVHLALNERTHGIIGAREIGLMKPAALFVNTARGKLVDQAALVAALRERRIGCAALDVFAEEPLPATTRCTSYTSNQSIMSLSRRTRPGRACGPGCAASRSST
jgi:phosphoglycerate dehydrogenase-like enzyme